MDLNQELQEKFIQSREFLSLILEYKFLKERQLELSGKTH